MKLLNETQQEQLKEISKYLLQVRQEKSIRIEEIAAKTHIRLAFLQALDAGQFEDLPEPVYIQGFIRRYGEALGLDGATLANSFTANTEPTNFNNHSHKLNKKPEIRIPLFIPYVLLLVVASIGLIYILNPKLVAQFISKRQNPVVTKTQKIAPTVVSLPTTSPESVASSTVTVTLELQDKSWLQVTVDGKTEFIGNLPKGERRTWTATKQLTVRSGNAGAVLISTNSQPPTPLGNSGAVKEVTFTPGVNGQ